VQLTLFSGRGEPLAERLVFVDHDDEMKIAFRASDVYSDEGAKIRFDIWVSDRNNKPLKSNLSLSVVKQAADTTASAGQIVSYMLLASDLTGYVEDPSYYFKDDPGAPVALDNLMLTQGWRRFDWKNILAGMYPEITYFEEKGIAINGRIVHDFFDIPLKGCLVRLTIMDEYNDVFTQYSGEGGYFNFDGLYYTDTVNIKIEAWRKSGHRNLVIAVPESIPQEVRQFYGDYNLTTVSERDNKQYRIRKAKEYNESMIKAQKELEDPDNNRLTGIHNPPEDILTSDEIPSGTRNIFEALTGRIPGVMVTGDKILIRGPSTLYGKTQPLFLVDNLPVEDVNSIKSIPIETIDRIEVLKGPEAAIYGVRGSNGVIAIYTKRGKFMLRGVMEYDILGYNLPKTFYQPEYTPRTEPNYDYTLVWIPYIQTGENGTAQVMFDKPVTGGEYRFVIEGISYNGQVGHSEAIIENLD
jgi:TonB-dependent SusC/RagA subfamily outer membrane receptor